MNKPSVFFSHSGRDKKVLIRIKELFVKKTASSIDVFLSSDGQSIPLGLNWVHSILESLERAALMVVFISPNSLKSNWIYFESGYAYSKGIRVVPIGFLGVDLLTLPPPLSLLQGFNITSEEGLNNLIVLTNEAFKHSHEAKFTPEEYRDIFLSSCVLSSQVFGDYCSLIDDIIIELRQQDGLDIEPAAVLDSIKELLKKEGIGDTRSGASLNFHGILIGAHSDINPPQLKISMDISIADVTVPLLERVILKLRSAGIDDIRLRLDFVQTVQFITDHYKVTSRLYGSDVKFTSDNRFIWQDIEFHIAHSTRCGCGSISIDTAYLSMIFHSNKIPIFQIRKLLDFLFERGILFYTYSSVVS